LATVIIFLLIVGGIALAYAGSAHGWLPRSRDEAETLVFGSLFMVFLVVVSLAILSQWPGPRRALYLVVALALCVQAAAIAIDVVVHRGALPGGRVGGLLLAAPYVVILVAGTRLVPRQLKHE
jgi:hypothetical protein